MAPEAKTVPFRESSKTSEDNCGSSKRRRNVDGGHQLDMEKEQQQIEEDNHHHQYFTSVSPTVKERKGQREHLIMKEKELAQVKIDVDLLERSCCDQATSNNKTSSKGFSQYAREKPNNSSTSNHHHDQQRRDQETPRQSSRKSRKPSFSSVFWIIALVTGSWINSCFAQGKRMLYS